MKKFVDIFKNKIILFVLILLVSLLFTTASITTPMLSIDKRIDQVPTCSKPSGQIIASGIDISSYQGNVDFNKVKADGVDFVILRVGTSKGMDKNFHTYYNSAIKAGLDVGCYFYTYSTTVEETRKEAYNVLKEIQGKTFSYPVFYDFEYPQLLSYDRIDTNTDMVLEFCKIIKRAGYYPGLYTSSSYHSDFLHTSLIDTTLDVWVANYSDYSGIDKFNYSSNFSMWQYSNIGNINGINADVDLNYSFVDYPSLINKFNYRVSKIK